MFHVWDIEAVLRESKLDSSESRKKLLEDWPEVKADLMWVKGICCDFKDKPSLDEIKKKLLPNTKGMAVMSKYAHDVWEEALKVNMFDSTIFDDKHSETLPTNPLLPEFTIDMDFKTWRSTKNKAKLRNMVEADFNWIYFTYALARVDHDYKSQYFYLISFLKIAGFNSYAPLLKRANNQLTLRAHHRSVLLQRYHDKLSAEDTDRISRHFEALYHLNMLNFLTELHAWLEK